MMNNHITQLQILVLFIDCISLGLNMETIDSNFPDIHSYLPDSVHQTSRIWQLPDISTQTGKIIQYRLGLKTHEGKFKLTEIGKQSLPKWLSYNDENDSIEGVPTESDIGQFHIAIVPEDTNELKHYFVITVHDNLNYKPLPLKYVQNVRFKCRVDDPITTASVVVDANPANMDTRQKINVLNNFSKHLKLPVDSLSFLPLGNRPAYDATALVAGPGNSKTQQHPGLLLSWQIGCGSVDATSMAVLENVEASAISGKLSDAIGYPIIGWHVTNNLPNVKFLKRRKRQVYSTPTLDRGRPTEAPPSGDMNRVVPSQTTAYEGNKHRTKTAGRHFQVKTKRPSPRSAMPTPMYTPAKPTVLLQSTDLSRPNINPSLSKDMMMTPTPEYPVRHTEIVQPSIDNKPLPVTPTKPLPATPTEVDIGPDGGHNIRPTGTIDTKATDSPVFPEDNNEKPKLKHSIGRITAIVGRVLEYRIPFDIFHDKEDGDTTKLKLLVLDGELDLPRSSWVQFNQKEQLLFGLPMEKDEARRVYRYTLAAVDSGGKIARIPFDIVVKKAKKYHRKPATHEFVLTIDEIYERFNADVENSISIVRKIAQLYGDKDTDGILIRKIARGSVKFSWTNTTLRKSPCPSKDIMDLLSYIIHDNDTLNPRLLEVMKPYKIKTALARSLGSCANVVFTPSPPRRPHHGYTIPVDTKENIGNDESGSGSSDNFLVTIIIPAAVIGAMILLAIIIACVLYHSRRKGKLSDEDKQNFVNKGIPVIFADEIEDKPDPPTKPLILPQERPPQPPPEYHSLPRSKPHRKVAPPHYDEVEMTGFSNHRDDRDNSPPYQPPPPITAPNGSRNAKPRSNAHKQIPFYVPP